AVACCTFRSLVPTAFPPHITSTIDSHAPLLHCHLPACTDHRRCHASPDPFCQPCRIGVERVQHQLLRSQGRRYRCHRNGCHPAVHLRLVEPRHYRGPCGRACRLLQANGDGCRQFHCNGGHHLDRTHGAEGGRRSVQVPEQAQHQLP